MCAQDPFIQHQLPHRHNKTEHHHCHQRRTVADEQEQQAPGTRKSATGCVSGRRTAATTLQIWYILHVILVLIDKYTACEICQMELQILKAIDFNLSHPLPIHFLHRYSKAADVKDEHQAMAKYFIELAALDYGLSGNKPSEIAASSLFLSLNLMNGENEAATGFNERNWSATLTFYSRYSADHLYPISKKMAKLARDAPQAKLNSIYNKYRGSQFLKIALHPELRGPQLDSIIAQLKTV